MSANSHKAPHVDIHEVFRPIRLDYLWMGFWQRDQDRMLHQHLNFQQIKDRSLHLACTSAASPVASGASTDFRKTLLSAPNQGHPGNVGLSCLRLREGSLAVTSIRCEHIGHGCRNSAAACHIRWLAHLRQTHRIRDAEPDVGGSQFCSRRSCHVALDPCCSPGRFVLRLKNAVLNVYCPDCIKEHWLEFFFIW